MKTKTSLLAAGMLVAAAPAGEPSLEQTDLPTGGSRPPALLLPRKACLGAALGLLGALAVVGPPARAAVTEAWVHRHSTVVSNSNDSAVKVVRDGANDIIVTGTTDDGTSGQDMLTIKYSGVDGSVLWLKRYNGPGNTDDFPQALAVDGTGNVLVTGYSSNGTNSDYYTAKYTAADGTLLWERRYSGPENSWNAARAVAADANGNVAVTGISYHGTNGDFYTVKYAATNGTILWERRYIGGYGYPTAMAVDNSGNVVITGPSWNGAPNDDADYYTAKYASADGGLLWEERYNGTANSHDLAQAATVDASGNVVVTGWSYNSYNSLIAPDYYTAKYAAANGALLWEQRYNNGAVNGSDIAQAVAVDGSGNVVVTGLSWNRDSGIDDAYTVKYAATDGARLWEQRYNGFAETDASTLAVAVDSSGNVVVTGTSIGDYYTAKYAAADGTLLWEKRYHDPATSAQATAIVVDSSGNVVVTGFTGSYFYGSGYEKVNDYYTAKYAAANGALLWEKRYNGPAKGNNQAAAVAVDSSGKVVVTGSSQNGAPNYDSDYYTAKYALADGALLWEKRYNGPANSFDCATGVAIDVSGNVVVTGSSNNATNSDYYTAKYAVADGTLLWEKRGPGGVAYGVAVDADSNVVVTGNNDDYYTAKYAAADGALLWEKRGPNGHAAAVAVDGSGNAVVTGYFGWCLDCDSRDNYTAKYAAADGALLWEKHYDDLGGWYDKAHALAVDASGNVVVTGPYYTAKYAAADGALLWEKRDPNGSAAAVAVDSSGNVVVTGGSGIGTDGDYYTAKYAAADGALLWEKRGPNGSAAVVGVDGSGNVVVTGSSHNGTNDDYRTAKYAVADGALLWEESYNGPANGNDTASSLAIGPNGMVAVTGSSSGDYATVVYRENLPPVSIALVSTGTRVSFTGVPGRTYTIERARAVTGPWSTVVTPTVPSNGSIEYIDANPPAAGAFYRTSEPAR